jgi:hypothetical protein
MERLRRNEWPLKLHFERPFQPGSLGDVFALAKTTDLVLQTQMFKALLKRGCRLNFHNDKGESINSMIWATTSQLIWRQEPKKRKLDLTAFVKKNGPWKTKKQAEVLRTAGIRSPSDLQVFAAQKSTMYNRTFEEIGLLSKDHERMFNATTSSLTETFTADMEGLSARCLYDFISVKAEKAFTFVIEFEKPMNVRKRSNQDKLSPLLLTLHLFRLSALEIVFLREASAQLLQKSKNRWCKLSCICATLTARQARFQ